MVALMLKYIMNNILPLVYTVVRMFFKEIKQLKSGARSGELKFDEIVVKTPTFMPVGTRGSVKGLSNAQVASTGAGIVLGNTYHLHLNPG